MKPRRGASLVELLVVMSAATVVLTLSASLIHRIMHAQSKARAFADAERTSLRLSHVFRADIHQAKAATVAAANSSDTTFLRLDLPADQTIEYRHSGAEIERVLLKDNQILARDQFAFRPRIELEIRRDEPRLIVLTIHSHPGEIPTADGRSEPSAYAVPVHLQVQAALNRAPAIRGPVP